MSKKIIGVIVGSLRKDSFSQSIARATAGFLSDGFEARFIDIGELPLYDQDLDANSPKAWEDFRAQVKDVDGFLFVTPEHNRSYPAALKNALDVGSRPYGASVWGGKPGAIISVTPGGLGAFGANHHLRQVLSFLNIPTLQQPEAYISNVHTLLDNQGNLTDADTAGYLHGFATAFENWVNLISGK